MNRAPPSGGPYHKKRCILPASSFIEWQQTGHDKQPYVIMRGKKPLVFAGLWDCWQEEMLSCTLITTGAAGIIRPIHERMPVMLDSQGIRVWLDPETPVATLNALLEPRLPYRLVARPISPAINNSRNKAPYQVVDT